MLDSISGQAKVAHLGPKPTSGQRFAHNPLMKIPHLESKPVRQLILLSYTSCFHI